MDQPNPTQQPSQNSQPAATTAPERAAIWVIATYILFFVPLLKDNMKNDPFYKFHMRQSLGLLICSVVASVIRELPVIGVFGPLLSLAVFVLWVASLYQATQGKMEKTPLVGQLFDKLPQF